MNFGGIEKLWGGGGESSKVEDGKEAGLEISKSKLITFLLLVVGTTGAFAQQIEQAKTPEDLESIKKEAKAFADHLSGVQKEQEAKNIQATSGDSSYVFTDGSRGYELKVQGNTGYVTFFDADRNGSPETATGQYTDGTEINQYFGDLAPADDWGPEKKVAWEKEIQLDIKKLKNNATVLGAYRNGLEKVQQGVSVSASAEVAQ